jgi:hypothetical protein
MERESDKGVTVTWIRHAESTFNAYGDRSVDVPLTNKGKEDASKICGEYEYCLVSPLLRARQTLALSSIKSPRIQISSLVREFTGGVPPNLLSGEETHFEDEEAVRSRVEELYDYLIFLGKKYSSIAIISHHDFILAATGHSLANCGGAVFLLRSVKVKEPI